jgi:hypothetical protein
VHSGNILFADHLAEVDEIVNQLRAQPIDQVHDLQVLLDLESTRQQKDNSNVERRPKQTRVHPSGVEMHAK